MDIAYISPTGSVFLHVSAAGIKRLEELNIDLTEHYMSKVRRKGSVCSVTARSMQGLSQDFRFCEYFYVLRVCTG